LASDGLSRVVTRTVDSESLQVPARARSDTIRCVPDLILVVEDEPKVAQALGEGLAKKATR
jgi:hypothetical protein